VPTSVARNGATTVSSEYLIQNFGHSLTGMATFPAASLCRYCHIISFTASVYSM